MKEKENKLKGRKTLKVGNFLKEFEEKTTDESTRKEDTANPLSDLFDLNPGKKTEKKKPVKAGSRKKTREETAGKKIGKEEKAPIKAKTKKKASRKKANKPEPVISNQVKLLPSPSMVYQQEDFKTEITFQVIAEYYHRRLYDNQQAIAYLEGRGFRKTELYRQLFVGYVDGSLISRLSENQRRQLMNMGIIDSDGTEHFHGCLTFPLFDPDNQIVGFYGRRTTDE